jgi:hypothetical protein
MEPEWLMAEHLFALEDEGAARPAPPPAGTNGSPLLPWGFRC